MGIDFRWRVWFGVHHLGDLGSMLLLIRCIDFHRKIYSYIDGQEDLNRYCESRPRASFRLMRRSGVESNE